MNERWKAPAVGSSDKWSTMLSGSHAFGFRRVRKDSSWPGARGLDECGQATKGTWGISWRQEALKGVEDCEKLGETVKRVLIPRFPN